MGLVGALARAGGLLLALTLGTNAIYVSSEEGTQPKYCTVYTHMVKAGGSSLKQKLLIAAREDGGRPPLFCNQGGASDEACLEASPNAAVITGGNVEKMRHGLDEMGRQCEFFTMLRHPIDRAISAFFYCPQDHDIQNRPPEWCGYSNHPTPITTRLAGFLKNVWGNMAFRQLSAGLNCHQGGICTHQRTPAGGQRTILQDVEAILKTYTAIGIMEHWDTSMQLFDAKVKSSVRSWQEHRHANPGVGSPLRNEVYRWAHENPEIHQMVETDMLLYSYALSMFKLQTNETLGISWS